MKAEPYALPGMVEVGNVWEMVFCSASYAPYLALSSMFFWLVDRISWAVPFLRYAGM